MRNSKMVQYYFLGRGAISNLPDLLNNKKAGATDAFVVMVIDHYFEHKNILDLSYLSSEDLIIYAQTDDEPKTSYVDQLVDLARSKGRLPVAIVGIGGGSAMDISKAISVLLTNEGPSENYQGWDLVKNPAIYKIGIPTIAGTGAEFTRTAVLTGPTKKLGINSDQSVFDQIILDANLLTTVPKEQFLYTAMDCYVHNAESLLGRINDSMTIALAEKSTKMIEDIFLGEMDLEKLLVASGMGLRHGYAICIAFNQLEEYYPQVKTFKEILKKYEIELPKIITEAITDEQLDRMAEATLKNENPLSNAFGPDWKTIFSKEKVIALLKKM